jgi:hypothetical protein
MTTPIDAHDERTGYCRMLGHHLPFGYCRTGTGNLPCSKILDCWFETFDIRAFIQEHFTKEEIESFTAPPKPKVHTILDLIEQAKRRVEG